MSDMDLDDFAEQIGDLAEDLVDELDADNIEAVDVILDDLKSSVLKMRVVFNRACR